jgi:uncharacterized membrane protein
MERSELDRFAEHYKLKADAVQRLLIDTLAWPTPLQWQQFGVRVLRGVGIVSLSAAIIFWIAANWQNFGAMIKFFALDALLILCIGLACWRPPMHLVGRSALTVAFVITGTLLALFGMTYQTGANTYELFFGWAALGIPLVLLARTLSAWVLWWVVLVVAMVLYAPVQFGLAFGFWSLEADLLQMHWLVPGAISLVMATVFAISPNSLVPHNVGARMSVIAIASAIAFATFEGVNLALRGPFVLFVLQTAAYMAFAFWAHQKRALAVLAMLAASWIVLSTLWLAKLTPNFDFAGSLLTGIWILLSASIAVTVLTRWHRAWGKQS